MTDLTVLVTTAGAQYIPAFFRCLMRNGERNIRIVGVDCSNDKSILQMVDTLYQVPYVTDSSYIPTILQICKKEKVDIVIPYMSAELLSFIENKKKFEEIGTIISVANEFAVKTCLSKLSLYDFMAENEIDVPEYYPVRSIDDLDNAFRLLGYPYKAVCVKATRLSGSRGVRIVDPNKSRFDVLFGEKPNSMYTTYEELKNVLMERPFGFPEMMAMECLTGEEFSVDVLADNGKLKYICGRKSNTILASIPQTATLFHDNAAYEICRQVVELLNIDGNADFDFRYDSSGKPVLMECNPRVAATMGIFQMGGLNLPYLRIKQLLGEPLPPIDVETGWKMVRRYEEYYSK